MFNCVNYYICTALTFVTVVRIFRIKCLCVPIHLCIPTFTHRRPNESVSLDLRPVFSIVLRTFLISFSISIMLHSYILAQLAELIVKRSKTVCLSVCVCVCVNHSATNHNRRTLRPHTYWWTLTTNQKLIWLSLHVCCQNAYIAVLTAELTAHGLPLVFSVLFIMKIVHKVHTQF